MNINEAKAMAQRLRDRIHDSHMTIEIMCDEAADTIDWLCAEGERLEQDGTGDAHRSDGEWLGPCNCSE
jgi:hypothetical protein